MAHAAEEKRKHDTVLDVTEEQIARVYAQAFLGAAEKSPNVSGLVDEVVSLVGDVLDKFPPLEQLLRSEFISVEKKQAILDRLFGDRASPEVLNFLKVLSAHGRLVILRSISRNLKKLFAKWRGLTDIEVRLAREPGDALRKEIEEQLRKSLRCEPILHISVDPSLIAGMVVKVGDTVYDGSIQTQLNNARRSMMDRVIESIETRPEQFILSN